MAGQKLSPHEHVDRPPAPTDPEARKLYVLRLREEIRKGTYHIPADKVAEKIIEAEMLD